MSAEQSQSAFESGFEDNPFGRLYEKEIELSNPQIQQYNAEI